MQANLNCWLHLRARSGKTIPQSRTASGDIDIELGEFYVKPQLVNVPAPPLLYILYLATDGPALQ